jgi:hypothetical protein
MKGFWRVMAVAVVLAALPLLLKPAVAKVPAGSPMQMVVTGQDSVPVGKVHCKAGPDGLCTYIGTHCEFVCGG